MKFALVTTTINVPRVLRWYRAIGPVKMFVVGDEKTPHYQVQALCSGINATYIHPDQHGAWKCAKHIGPNSIQKRNIGFLEALKWGADVIVSVDDDNLPVDPFYFDDYTRVFSKPYNGLLATPTGGFFDIGDFLFPKSKQRGVPHDNEAALEISHIVGARIGVAQGLCIGAPDIDAATRFVNKDSVHVISEIARAGVVVDNRSRTIWNSQNTAVHRELIPAWPMWSFSGRYDDIYASIMAHRVMREYGFHAHYGKPMVFQQRNEHDLAKDMRAEVDGYSNARKLADVLDRIQLRGQSVIDDCRLIWRALATCDWISSKTIAAATAFLDDCESYEI